MNLEDIEATVYKSINEGSIDRVTHDKILSAIQSDGKIDEEEKELLSKLFRAIQSGEVKLIDEVCLPQKDLKKISRLKEDALLRNNTGQEYKNHIKKEPIIEKVPSQFITKEETKTAFQNTEISSIESSFGTAHSRRDSGKNFTLRNDRILDVNLNGMAWIKTGSMVGYYGSMKFTREGITEHGVAKTLKKVITGEGTSLTRATGSGNLFLADQGKKISIVNLGSYSLVVNGSNLLAFEETINWDITWLKQFAAYVKGGMFNVRLNGNGMAAITSNGDPLMLKVTPLDPVMTDMNATVAWSGSLAPQFKTDISASTLIGRAGGESIQMRFEGEGFVIIQPFEEPLRTNSE